MIVINKEKQLKKYLNKNSDLEIKENVEINVPFSISGKIICKGKVIFNKYVSCYGLGIDGDIYNNANIEIHGDVNCHSIYSEKKVKCGGDINCKYSFLSKEDVCCSGNISCLNNLIVRGDLSTTGNIYLGEDLNVLGDLCCSFDIQCGGYFYCYGRFEHKGLLLVKQKLIKKYLLVGNLGKGKSNTFFYIPKNKRFSAMVSAYNFEGNIKDFQELIKKKHKQENPDFYKEYIAAIQFAKTFI